jgi:uncharacterized protein (TIGR00661 family)
MMKILYAIQGTGNGHLSRAREIIPLLSKKCHVDILISGTQAEIEFPFPVKYRFNGLGFSFGSNGGIDLVETYKKNYIKILLAEINSLPVFEYDFVINDFEPVSAWSCYINNVDCISLSHQSAILRKNAPKPGEMDIVGRAVLKNYAPAKTQYGFHFKAYDNLTFTPVIRSEVRNIKIENKGHYTVYLAAYNEKRILKVLSLFPDEKWEVFSRQCKQPYNEGNIYFKPVNNERFIESLATSDGVICGAGFETPAEALFMGKKLIVVPMKGQYEQQCNAAALKDMGVMVLKSFNPEHSFKIDYWIKNGKAPQVDFPEISGKIIDKLFSAHAKQKVTKAAIKPKKYTGDKFRKLILRKIVDQF